jgi:pimeloyl-ACP methyl ester carboxylesterase
MQRAQLDGVRLSYLRRGRGPDLVLVHGLATSLAFWFLGIMRPLARGHRVMAYDLRGHGRSSMPPAGYTTAQMADDLAALLEHVGADRPVDVVGHSFGGAVAMHLALRHPERVRSLVLADARIRSLQPRQRLRDWPLWPAWRAQLQRAGLPALDADREMDFELLEEWAQPRWRPLRERAAGDDAGFLPFGGPEGRGGAAERWLRLLRETSARQELAETDGMTPDAIAGIDVPVLATFGEHSHCLGTLHALREVLPDCEAVVVPGVGHFHPVRRPAAFVGQVRGFLREAA